MRTLGQLFAGRLAIALAIVFALLSAPTGSSAFHEAASKGHLSVTVADSHGHSHDVDVASGDEVSTKAKGDHHKHNPGDHSHEKPGIPPEVATLFVGGLRTRPVIVADTALPGLSTTLDRPPRPSDIA